MTNLAVKWENVGEAARWWNTGRPLTHPLAHDEKGAAVKATQPCAIDGCDRPAHARTWCTMHYQRWKRTGDPVTVVAARNPPECIVAGCSRPVHGRGLCGAHWNRLHRHGDPLGGGPDRQWQAETCSIENCERAPKSKGMCQWHGRAEKMAIDPEFRAARKREMQAWAAKNALYVAECQRSYRNENRDVLMQALRDWKENNPGASYTYGYTRRRRLYRLPVLVIEVVEPDVVYDRDEGLCQLCREPVDLDLPWPQPMSMTIDHRIPVIDPASEHSYSNCQLTHWSCNQRKHVRTRP